MWPVPNRFPTLETADIHVWHISLVSTENEQVSLRALLSEDELRRADRFLFERHRRRFVTGRAHMRRILARYLETLPESISFEYTGLGKPRLHGSRPGRGWCFNFSNSHQRALLAIARDVEIGVDIEHLRNMASLEGLAERYFADDETRYILAQPEPLRTMSFFHCWTRKEAFLKAIGKGLAFPLTDVTVILNPTSDVRIVAINDEAQEAGDWTLEHLDVEPEYVGAMACKRLGNRIARFRWEKAD